MHRRNIGLSHYNPHAWPKPERRVDVRISPPLTWPPAWWVWMAGAAAVVGLVTGWFA
jgi:hypothetical protein